MPAFVGRKLLCYSDYIRGSVLFELNVGFIEERQQLLHHTTDVTGIDQGETQFNCPPKKNNQQKISNQKNF